MFRLRVLKNVLWLQKPDLKHVYKTWRLIFVNTDITNFHNEIISWCLIMRTSSILADSLFNFEVPSFVNDKITHQKTSVKKKRWLLQKLIFVGWFIYKQAEYCRKDGHQEKNDHDDFFPFYSFPATFWG